MVVGIFFILEGQSSVGHVIDVLQPLEVGHGDTSGVDVQVWNDQDVVLEQDLVGGRCDWSVGRFRDQLKTKTPFLITD